jgi:hypothetical protein
VPKKSSNGTVHKATKPLLDPAASKRLRDQLLTEIGLLKDSDGLALWAHRRLASKNMLIVEDALVVEAAYQSLLEACVDSGPHRALARPTTSSDEQTAFDPGVEATEPAAFKVTSRAKSVRRRSKAHIAFVGSQPCLVCERGPCDAHHLKFAEPRALGLKVSDQFTVPLCRSHHQDLHRHGNELGWWANMHIEPLPIARRLWQTSRIHDESSSTKATSTADSQIDDLQYPAQPTT